MAYFNHAFQKTFLGTGSTLTNKSVTLLNGTILTNVDTSFGFVLPTGDNIPSYALNQLPALGTAYNNGYFGFFDPKTNLLSDLANCCSAYLAGSAIYTNDKIGPFAGGYQETNKSKMINPKYVSDFYRVDPCLPSTNVINVGSTSYTAGEAVLTYTDNIDGTGYANSVTPVLFTTTGGTGTGLTYFATVAAGVPTIIDVMNPGKGYTAADVVTLVGGNSDATVTIDTVSVAAGTANCCKEFLCGETYSLRVDIKGSPALRLLNHNAYLIADAYTGCCATGALAPTAVDSTEVFILWANALLNSPITKSFLEIIVQDEAGVLWYAPGTSAAFLLAVGANTWDNYVSPGHVDGTCAGMIMNGAYVDTKFGDCTFQISDFYEKQPVKLYASEVDFNGDPCEFEGICVVTECEGNQAMGLGESVLRDLILSESYRQNFLASDFRIREITQGNQLVTAIDRTALYTRYYLLHVVPRFNNPSGTFDNDRYLLEVITNATIPNLETAVNDWLESCGTECAFQEFTCGTDCTPVTPFPSVKK